MTRPGLCSLLLTLTLACGDGGGSTAATAATTTGTTGTTGSGTTGGGTTTVAAPTTTDGGSATDAMTSAASTTAVDPTTQGPETTTTTATTGDPETTAVSGTTDLSTGSGTTDLSTSSSTTAAVDPPPPPTMPSGCTTCECCDPWPIAWAAVPGATHYLVRWKCSINPEQEWDVGDVTTIADVCEDIAMCNGMCAFTVGYIRVLACNEDGCSAPIDIPADEIPISCGGGCCC